MKKIILITVAAVAALGLLATAYLTTACPCDRIPGIALWGEEQTEPVSDWEFANVVGLCQLQVSDGLLPQSLNLNCMSADGELFVSCSRCESKRWSNTALANPNGRIRIDGKVYQVVMTRLTDPEMLDNAWSARSAKLRNLGRDVSGDRPDHWWSFQLNSPGA